MIISSLADLLALNKTQRNKPDTRHVSYLAHESQVKMVNDLYNGVDTTVQYLFQFPQEAPDTFATRKDRATLRNFVKRAVEAFTGMIFRKPLEVGGYGARTTRLFPTIDTRNSINHFTKGVTNVVTKDGIAYILTDSPASGGEPYLVLITRDQLINWRKDEKGNFTMIVIEEIIGIPAGEFGTTYILQWRHYTQDGTIKLYRKDDSSDIILYDTIDTDYEGIPIVEIFIDSVPILYDTAKLNIKHFNRASHKDRYLTMAALPIPVIWGADVDDEGNTTTATPALVIGVDEAFIFSSKEDGDFQWRELSGDSIGELQKDLDATVEDITTGILRAADSSSQVQKTATEVALLQAEASDRVSAIAIAVETGMRDALELLAEFSNEVVPDDAVFILSKDFNAALAGSDGQRVIMEAYLQGLVSIETFLAALSDAELIPIESVSKELDRIKADTFIPVPKGVDAIKQDNRTASVSASNEDEK